MRKSRLLAGAALGAVALTLVIGGRPLLAGLVARVIRLRHPGAGWITTDELAEWQADRSRPAPLLLDVRTEAEYAVSHLPGARRVEPGAPLPADLLALPRETPIVAYCALGYRSGLVTTELREAGFQAARNLEGSIFVWAAEGRALVDGNGPVAVVHPVSGAWGLLLPSRLRAPLAR